MMSSDKLSKKLTFYLKDKVSIPSLPKKLFFNQFQRKKEMTIPLFKQL